MTCEVCQQPTEEIMFFDHNQEKQVAYHRQCYADKFNAPHVLTTPSDV